ncbi:MAG: penicillin-binding protein 1C, partial [Planctomycetes bacterium]|nr:penicillin-binding protein 1C [Planctomycetota bacterium]
MEFLDRHEIPLRLLLVDNARYQQITALDAISPHLIDATLAAEDARFFHHHGVDLLSIGRASWNALREQGPLSGASTITQQLAKIADKGPRTPLRKIQETWRALHMECQWGKNHILTEYLNRLDYGQLRVGIASASEHYFGKPTSDLSTAESAFLAGLPKAPSRLNPAINLPAALARQRWVLKRMQATGVISAHEYDRALREPLRLRTPVQTFSAPHFVDLLLQRR